MVRWLVLAALLAALLAGLLAACSADTPDAGATLSAPPPGATTGGPLGLEITQSERDAAVAASLDVRAERCGPRVGFGTASMIGPNLAVTAAHVVAGATEVQVRDVTGRASAAEVVLFDPDLDLAVVRTADAVGEPIDIRSNEAAAGELGVVALPRWIGDDLQLDVVEVSIVRTVNISTTDIYLERDVDRAGFEVDAAIEPGNSGALVVLAGGGAGIVWARSNRSDGRAWAIDLPDVILDDDQLEQLIDPVSTGRCLE